MTNMGSIVEEFGQTRPFASFRENHERTIR